MKSIAFLIASYNRVALTSSCAGKLIAIKTKLSTEALIDIFLVDDCSSDGTAEVISELYPDINVISSGGDLYWNASLYMAWNTAFKHNFDYYIWLNDDVDLVIERVIEVLRFLDDSCISVGSTVSRSTGICTYGCYDTSNKLMAISDVDLYFRGRFNGNFVVVPKSVFMVLGFNDPKYLHSMGDIDYSHRAVKEGISIKMLAGYIGYCERQPKLNVRIPGLLARFRNLYHPLCYENPHNIFRLYWKNGNRVKAILLFLKIHLKVFIPATQSRG